MWEELSEIENNSSLLIGAVTGDDRIRLLIAASVEI